MLKYLKYLKYVIRHKWFVFLECRKEGILWLGIIHDWSKLLPNEFIPYANYFYGKGSDITRGRDATGYYKPTDTGDFRFDFAWLLHQKRNKHHWQWWVLPEDEGGLKVLEMPQRYMKEMLCDWRGAGRAQMKKKYQENSTQAWYLKHAKKMKLDFRTRAYINGRLNVKHPDL